MRGSTNTSSICELPVSAVKRTATWPVPPVSRPGTAARVSIGRLGFDRSYRAALPHAAAVAQMVENAGTQFDPDVVSALLAIVGAPLTAPVFDSEADLASRVDVAAVITA